MDIQTVRVFILITLIAFILFVFAEEADAETTTIPIVKTTYISKQSPVTNFSKSDYLYLGYFKSPCSPPSPWDTTPYTCPPDERKVLLEIPDFTASLSHTDDTVEKATMHIYTNSSSNTTVEVEVVTSPIDTATIVWDTLPPSEPLSNIFVPAGKSFTDISILEMFPQRPGPKAELRGILLSPISDDTQIIIPSSSSGFPQKLMPKLNLAIANASKQPDIQPKSTDTENPIPKPEKKDDSTAKEEPLAHIGSEDPILNTNAYADATKPEIHTIIDHLPESYAYECSIDYFPYEDSYSIRSCSIDQPIILATEHTYLSNRKTYLLEIEARSSNRMRVTLYHHSCAPRSLFNHHTWIKCRSEIRVSMHEAVITPVLTAIIRNNDDTIDSNTYNERDNIHTLIVSSKRSFEGKPLSVSSMNYVSVETEEGWLDMRIPSKRTSWTLVPAPKLVKKREAPFGFMFPRPIGVTQWHGYTAFQHPHTGIDFGATSEPVLSAGDGTVVSAGWDSTYGRCLSGGRILIIKHKGGKHSAYFHLADFNNSHGGTLSPGDKVSKGDQIGTSGNTGTYNCQPLGYHLHFEIRRKRKQSSHVDPVPYIDIDWSKIPTLDWESIPGRLTGDNPHPRY